MGEGVGVGLVATPGPRTGPWKRALAWACLHWPWSESGPGPHVGFEPRFSQNPKEPGPRNSICNSIKLKGLLKTILNPLDILSCGLSCVAPAPLDSGRVVCLCGLLAWAWPAWAGAGAGAWAWAGPW